MQIGMCFPRELEPGLVARFARQLDDAGADQLWVVEDCFYTTAPALVATAFANSEHLTVGIGILPAVIRNPALTAMDLSTLARLAPGRLIAGIGHGVQSWMDQIGARPASPVTALTDTVVAVKRLLAGERVTVDGDYVHLDDVALDPAPTTPPPVVVGASGPKSLAAAGRHADGLLLAELSGPSGIAAARRLAGAGDDFPIHSYTFLSIDDDRLAARRHIADVILGLAHRSAGMFAFDFADDIRQLAEREDRSGAIDEFVAAPDDWWTELGAIGTADDVLTHLGAIDAAGAASTILFPAPITEIALAQLDQVCADIIPAFLATR